MLFLLSVLYAAPSKGQGTTLMAGDIAFTGYNSNIYTAASTQTYNEFSFVILRTGGIAAGTLISFTDNGYNTAGGYNAYGPTSGLNEGIIVWTAPAGGLAQFSQVVIKTTSNGGAALESASAGSVTSYTAPFNLSVAGDQIIAYQGTALNGSATIIAGLHANSESSGGPSGISTLSAWDNGYTTFNGNRSSLPPGLKSNSAIATENTAVMLVNNNNVSGPWGASDEFDNWKYNCTGATGASVAAIRAAINDRANWVGQDAVSGAPNGGIYTLGTGCPFAIASAPSITSQPSNSSICVGGNTTFSVTASNATSYQWYVSTNNGSSFNPLSNTATYSGVTTGILTISAATAAMNGYQYRVVVTGTSAITSDAAVLAVSSPGTWLGGASNAWSNTANWSCSTLPTATTDVTIPSGTTYSPRVDITTAIANNITIASGTTLSFTGSSNVLEIKGAVTGNGTFNTASGKTIFSGSAQTIPAGTYQSLQVNGAGSKTLAGGVTVTGILTMTSGVILLGSSSLTITGTGSISGGSSSSFIVVNGTGGLIQQSIGASGRTGTILFPVGISTASYTPASINNAGTADNFTVRVISNVYTGYDASGNPTTSAETAKAVARTWNITEATNGGSNATVTLRWNGTDELPGFDRSNSFISHYFGGAWHRGPAAAAGGQDPYDLSLSGVTSFSPFGVGSPGSPLPLKLLDFSAQWQGRAVQLRWTTANESALAGFVVERSEDGKTFRQQSPELPAGNRDNGAYEFLDERSPVLAQQYYRLKIAEWNGTVSYSNILKLSSGDQQADFSVYPNPATGDELLIISRMPYTSLLVSVRDLMGRQYDAGPSRQNAQGLNVINIKGLPVGIYIVCLQADGRSQYFRIIRK